LKHFGNEKRKDEVLRFFQGNDGKTDSLGVAFKTVFELAKEFKSLPLTEVDKLLDNKYYEVRMGAVSIMDFQARDKKLPSAQRKALFDLYLDRHDRLNNWDFVDRAAPSVIGDYLIDKDRDILYTLAESSDPWRRRTSIVSTYAFIKKNDLDDTFRIGEKLVHDKFDLINKAVGSWIREAGKKDPRRLKTFLDKYAGSMPRITLRYAIEKLDKKSKDHYMNLKGKA
jgi:3-methyladenine DNA glycosylase AlkD